MANRRSRRDQQRANKQKTGQHQFVRGRSRSDAASVGPKTQVALGQPRRPPVVLVAGNVGVTALSKARRTALLARVDTQDALHRLATFQTQRDVAATTDWNEAQFDRHLIDDVRETWADRVKEKLGSGYVLAPAQTTMQLIRELVETDSTSTNLMTPTELAHLLLSVSSEQNARPEFAGDVPTPDEEAAVDRRYGAMSRQQLLAAVHSHLHEESANLLFHAPRKLECLKSDALDFWYSPWSPRADTILGACPADCFADTMGFTLDSFFTVGQAVVDAAAKGEAVIRIEDLPGTNELRDFVTAAMSLPLASLREMLASDRQRGEIRLQRFTFTQFPFLNLENGTLIVLRAQWAMERFFSEMPQFDVMAAMGKQEDAAAGRFNQAIKLQFEDSIGRTLQRIAARSPDIESVVHEHELQEHWKAGKGVVPSVCDWVLRADHVNILVEATHHPLKATLAQGIADGKAYDEDAERILTQRKFAQLASVMRLLNEKGWEGAPRADASFIALVVVPDTGLPSSSLAEMDNTIRAEKVFEEFQGRVTRPTVIQHLDLQLIEGLIDRLRLDAVDILRSWLTYPTPLTLQDYLDARQSPRPISNHIIRSARQLDRRLAST